MTQTPLAMHDALLANAPAGARHDADVCPFCKDWAMTNDGIPSGFGRLDEASRITPYGDVEYADAGFQSDGVKRFPIDTEPHARLTLQYLQDSANAGAYTKNQLSQMVQVTEAALAKFGVSVQPNTEMEGGTHQQMDTITQETHEALVEKALRDGTAALEAEKAALVTKVAELDANNATLSSEKAALEAENERLNGELDTAQIAVKAAQDEVATLKADIASKEQEAAKAEIASSRAEQVRTLGLFSEDYIVEKASRWADVDEAAWAERVEEWSAAKATSATTVTASTDTASAMTGTREVQSGAEASTRRKVLGL